MIFALNIEAKVRIIIQLSVFKNSIIWLPKFQIVTAIDSLQINILGWGRERRGGWGREWGGGWVLGGFEGRQYSYR